MDKLKSIDLLPAVDSVQLPAIKPAMMSICNIDNQPRTKFDALIFKGIKNSRNQKVYSQET